MLGEPLWYWLLFALVVLLVFGGPALISWWEHRQDERDRENWESMWR